mmetsp:Transcript_3282/g.4780  ORF Transcript_3282/g.4780 Transcript_3282/m.4780 type:complete len:575 (-) Transcript_3282:119-1843(-)|eukprot:CAMPEP_0203667374 /NCGR_PEP_ID=MMETSP0090-20130426/4214_1 /ASSEMBLY_ACC=CAM_ASM_001088 /TAXON_ID=426623 /ORGANISM="Chaetoceros affinis, Strain CCMP159" /LENGTH=574 /DNA_ID=CAMNT_0050531513 /DNA_START=92 /DNA_END=1816 /DNA_ORIENTATION=-
MKKVSSFCSSPPVSVLRKTGSSKCLQQDFHSKKKSVSVSPTSGSTGATQSSSTVTVVNYEQLPNFSTERYYTLSEIQMKAHSVQFLCDLVAGGGNNNVNDNNTHNDRRNDDDENTQDMSTSSHSFLNDNQPNDDTNENAAITATAQPQPQLQPQPRSRPFLPPSVILYLLWRPDSIYNTPSSFAEHVVQPSVQHLMNLYQCSVSPTNSDLNADTNTLVNGNYYDTSKLPLIYIVVDRIVIPQSQLQSQDMQENELELEEKAEEERNNIQIEIAQSLIRKLVSIDTSMPTATSTTQLRPIIQGITIGLSDNIRAAPGLEVCMDAVLVGDAERRRFSSKIKKQKKNKKTTKSEDGETICNSDSSSGCCWTMDKANSSSIGLITEYPDDLTGLDPNQETDAAQNDLNLHVRCCGVWEGRGNIMNYALASQKTWRSFWHSQYEDEDDNNNIYHRAMESGGSGSDDAHINDDSILNVYSFIMGRSGRKKRRRRTGKRINQKDSNKNLDNHDDDTASQSKYLPSKVEQQNAEQAANVMLFITILFFGYHFWSNYMTSFMELVESWTEQIQEKIENLQQEL